MDSQIIFLLIFFVFAVLQGIGQKRKQAGSQGQQPPTGEGEDVATSQGQDTSQGRETSQGQETSQGRERIQAASRQRSEAARGERAEAERRERVRVTPQRGSGAPPRTKGPERTSEGLIPGDVWEEILGLARGEAAPPTAPPKPVEEPVPSRTPLAESREGAVRRKPSSASVLRKAAPPVKLELAEDDSGFPESVRAGLFGDGSARELRKAVVLKEVLGPPVALRE